MLNTRLVNIQTLNNKTPDQNKTNTSYLHIIIVLDNNNNNTFLLFLLKTAKNQHWVKCVNFNINR